MKTPFTLKSSSRAPTPNPEGVNDLKVKSKAWPKEFDAPAARWTSKSDRKADQIPKKPINWKESTGKIPKNDQSAVESALDQEPSKKSTNDSIISSIGIPDHEASSQQDISNSMEKFFVRVFLPLPRNFQ
ncbi:hypothetical protein PCANC_14378 [Puccinia coronata f. sp. avenae]|uniref:Uncharacterized protein n=1 Tax=Puccinia coronata f. sp. avenae TaxID=200324 RepID=A0A2N5V9I7_9BASI|nr:hypothetical protein PCANC_14378 [Puccinia coronata f. sp. avenae]